MRTGLGRLYQAWSQDNGETWSRSQPTSLAVKHCAAKIRSLPSTGHLYIVWNQLSQGELYRGLNRTRISCAVSRNGGGVWEFFQNLHFCLEATCVAAGPIQPSRPGEVHALAGLPAANLEGGCVEPLPDNYWMGSYPFLLALDDRVLISHAYFGPHRAGRACPPRRQQPLRGHAIAVGLRRQRPRVRESHSR